MYADKTTKSMQRTIDETNRRHKIQIEYNSKNNITPTPLGKSKEMIMESTKVADGDFKKEVINQEDININGFKTKEAEIIKEFEKQMRKAAKELDFIEAANIRDKIKNKR